MESSPIPPSLYCEKIAIEVAGSYRERIPSLVLPHLLADLPIYLLWSKVPSADEPLLEYANRLIVDTEITSHFVANIQKLSLLMATLPCPVSDLAWSSLKGWRSLLASTFQEKAAFEKLLSAHTLNLSYYGASSSIVSAPIIRAIYLQAWLAHKLRWKLAAVEEKNEALSFRYRHTKGESTILLSADYDPLAPLPLPPGAIVSIDIECKEKNAHYCFKRNPDKQHVMVQASDSQECLLPYLVSLSGAQEGSEIIEELFRPSIKSSYPEVLSSLAQISWPTLTHGAFSP